MKILPTLLLLLLSFGQSYAETGTIERVEDEIKQYDVEVIIFEDAHARYLDSEMWPQAPAESDTMTDADTDTSPITITPLTDTLQTTKSGSPKTGTFENIKPVILTSAYERLVKSPEFNVLFYGAWRQQGLEKSQAFDIDLTKLANNNQTISANSVSGQLKVELARYLHFYSELEYQRQSGPGDSSSVSENQANDVKNTDAFTFRPAKFTLNDHTRMRSKELHYIDHPLVGILVQINPVDNTVNRN